MKLNKWEIWWADVKFEDSPQEKRRPVIVIDESTAFVLSLAITSSSPRPGYRDYVLRDWESAGLKKPSTVKLGRKVPLARDKFVSKIGVVSKTDQIRIMMQV